MHHFCTYFDSNYLAPALTLYQSLERHAQPFVLHALCFDDECHRKLTDLDLPHLRPIAQADFERGDDALLHAKSNRNTIEYYFTCTSSLLLYVLRKCPDAGDVTYLDADLFFYASPQPIYDEWGGGSIMIIPHRFPAHVRHKESCGVYNVGMVVFRNDASGLECLEWWRERCLEWCYDREEDGRFADQKYLDDWPTRFRQVVVLDHKGAGCAPWNLATYPIEERDGSVLVGGDPLIFYHFHHLKRVAPFLYDLGLDGYGAELTSCVRRRIYGTYLRELQSVSKRVSARLGRRRYARAYSARDVVWLLLHGRTLLCVGGAAIQISVGPTLRSLCHRRERRRDEN